jgi:hypothetical protein
MQRQTATNQRDAPGQDTGGSQGHLSSYLQEERLGRGTGLYVRQTVSGATHMAEDKTNARRRH